MGVFWLRLCFFVLLRGREADIPELVDHVAFWMPVLVLSVSKDLDKLLQDCRVTTIAALRELGRVVVVTVYLSVVFVIAVLRTKNRGTHRTCEMINVVLSIQSRNIGTSKRSTAFVTQQVEASKIISLAERILPASIFFVCREELGRYNLTTVLSGPKY